MAYLWGRSWLGDSEDHQPATSMDLSKAGGWEMRSARFTTGSLKLAYTCSLLSGWKMNCQLLSTCSDTTLHMAEACSACYLLSPQLGTHQVWERGVLARRRGKGIAFWCHPISLACISCGQEVSASHLCFLSRALEQDEGVKAGCQHMGAVSLLCRLHAQMLLFSRSGPCWFTFITPPLQLMWCCPSFPALLFVGRVFLQHRRC